MVADDEAAQHEPLLHQHHHVAGPGGCLGGVVGGDRAAGRDPAEVVEVADRGLEVLAADVVEVDVDRSVLAQLLADRAVVVVEGGVEAELLGQPAHLLGGAGRADHLRGAEVACHLAGERADGTGRTGHEDDVALLHLRDAGQPDVRRQAGHAEDPEVGGGRDRRGVDLPGGRGRQHGVLAPPGHVQHGVAGGEGVVVALDDLADGAALHGCVEGVGRDVGLGVVHPPAHVGVDGQEGVAHQDLAGAGRRQLGLDGAEVGGHRFPVRAGGQLDLSRGGAHAPDPASAPVRARRPPWRPVPGA